MRVRHGARACARRSARRPEAWRDPGREARRWAKPGGAGKGGREGCGSRARPLVAGGGGAPQASLPAPPLARVALPWLAPAPPAGLGNALSRRRARSQSPPPTSSGTSSSAAATAHLLPPPPPHPPSPPLSSSVLAFCRSSGKCRSSEIPFPSGPVRHPPAAPRPRDGFRALGISLAQRRGPLCALGAMELGKKRVQKMHARG